MAFTPRASSARGSVVGVGTGLYAHHAAVHNHAIPMDGATGRHDKLKDSAQTLRSQTTATPSHSAGMPTPWRASQEA